LVRRRLFHITPIAIAPMDVIPNQRSPYKYSSVSKPPAGVWSLHNHTTPTRRRSVSHGMGLVGTKNDTPRLVQPLRTSHDRKQISGCTRFRGDVSNKGQGQHQHLLKSVAGGSWGLPALRRAGLASPRWGWPVYRMWVLI
jgi:hypothetical protein